MAPAALPSRRRCLALGLALGGGLTPPVQAMAAPSLRVRARSAADGRLALHVQLQSPQARWLLVWGTPFEDGWFAPWLRVWRDGVELPYGGARAKRGVPERADYRRLAPGPGWRTQRWPDEAFDLHPPGAYRLELAWSWLDAPAHGMPPREPAQWQALAQPALALDWRR